jgi:hypothetical protein
MTKLSGFCGCVHGAFGSCSGVALCCSFIYCVVTTSMISCGLLRFWGGY